MQRFYPRTSSRGLLALTTALGAVYATADQSNESLLVMLQGTDLPAITQSATAHGAQITHELPVINALGARMTRAQLDAIRRDTPGITRVIDDLAWEPEPALPEESECGLSSAIELSWRGSRAEWVLFNKTAKPLTLSHGEIEWPESFGAVKGVEVDGSSLSARLAAGTTQMNWAAGERVTLAPKSETSVSFQFERGPENAAKAQQLIQLTASVDDECETRLVPSYDAPGDDSYFPSVSGAALLHSHGVTGDGVTVAVLDSGLWEASTEIARNTRGEPRIIARYDAIADAEVDEAFDESGHGTHMTSVIARSAAVTRMGASTPSYRGIAPDSGLVVIKAFGESGQAGFLDIVRGVQWVVDNRERLDIRVLNLSFSARPRWPYWEDPVNQALMRAWQSGIFIAAAAGNEGPDAMSVGSPGNLPYLLTVGAVTDSWTDMDRNDDYVPDFSSRGPTPMGHIKPDVVAMGGHIAGIVRPGSTLATQLPEFLLRNGEFVMTGTSQATALVSGLAALLLQLDPALTNNQLKCMFVSSAEPAINTDGRFAYSPFTQGSGIVSLQRALTIGQNECQQSSLNLPADMAGEEHFQGPAVFEEGRPPYLPGQSELISDKPSEKGTSTSRRWGIRAHLERLGDSQTESPIDWFSIFAEEQRRIDELARQRP